MKKYIFAFTIAQVIAFKDFTPDYADKLKDPDHMVGFGVEASGTVHVQYGCDRVGELADMLNRANRLGDEITIDYVGLNPQQRS